VIESAVDGIIVIDSGGLVEAFNPGAERLFGYAAAEVIGRNVNLLMPSPYHEEHDSYLTRYLATGTRKIIGIGREVKGRRKDGSVFPLHLSVGEMTIAGERRFTGMLHDLSDRVTLEEQLRDRTAMAKLGEMAAMIAHEVKNPLAGIRGAVQVIGGRLTAGNPDAPMMQEIVKRIDSLDAMMKDLLLFARPPKPKRAPTDVVPLLSATVGLLKTDEGAKQIDVEIEGSAPPVPADGEMLKMVFHNLLINGAHAMHGQGTIRVRVSTAEHALRVSVSDHGPGIPPTCATRSLRRSSRPNDAAPALGYQPPNDSSKRTTVASPWSARRPEARRSRCNCRSEAAASPQLRKNHQPLPSCGGIAVECAAMTAARALLFSRANGYQLRSARNSLHGPRRSGRRARPSPTPVWGTCRRDCARTPPGWRARGGGGRERARRPARRVRGAKARCAGPP
jgi:two-component system sensor kinase FixL